MVRREDGGWGSAPCFMAAALFHPSHSRETGPCCQKGPERTNRARLHPPGLPQPLPRMELRPGKPKGPPKGGRPPSVYDSCLHGGACAQAAAIPWTPQDLQPLLGARARHESGTVGATTCGSRCPGQGLCMPPGREVSARWGTGAKPWGHHLLKHQEVLEHRRDPTLSYSTNPRACIGAEPRAAPRARSPSLPSQTSRTTH